MIYFFRGKAATGKSTLALAIQNTREIEILSKDCFYDAFLREGQSTSEATSNAYDALCDAIKSCHQNGKPAIVDIGLAHKPYFEAFLSKLSLTHYQSYLFICSDDALWESRIRARIDHPTAPNQLFKTVSEASKHYAAYDITALMHEHIIDSALPIESLLKQFDQTLNA